MILIIICIGIIVLTIFFYFLVWWDKRRLKKLKENYDENEDKSKQGEAKRFWRGRDTGFKIAKSNDEGLDKPPRPKLLQTTTSRSSRKNSKSPRGIFKKLRRK